jgi:hypothetical protein
LEISGPSAQSSGNAGLYGLTPNLIPGTKDFTVEYWLNTRTGNDTYHRIVSSTNGAFSGGTFCMRHQPGSFLFTPGGGVSGIASYSVDFTLNTWTHVAYTRQGATGRGFINGRQVVTCGDTTNYTEAIQYIGSWYQGGTSEYFNGTLDDVRITMGVARYTIDFTPPARALPEVGGKSFTTTNINAGVVKSFTTVGTTSWTAPSDVIQVEVLVVAGGGGGGGGNNAGGAGGAGGLIYNNQYPVTPGQTYTVTVGAGGTGGTINTGNATAGGNSIFGNLTAIGGGQGGFASMANTPGYAGGSGGGGGAYTSGTPAGGAGTAGQGFAGGAGFATASNQCGAGGGGGAGGAGANSTQTQAGAGGPGLQLGISGIPTYYAGGGGGGAYQPNGSISVGIGGLGGGGTGGKTTGGGEATAGTANTGGGGGGAGYPATTGGNGGTGIVIVRYTTNTVGNTSDSTTDNLVDSPTLYGHDYGNGGEVVGNYATLNPLYNNSGVFSNGNLKFTDDGSNGWNNAKTTIGLRSGKWYWEMYNDAINGVICASVASQSAPLGYLPGQSDNYGVTYYNNGTLYYMTGGGGVANWGSSYTVGDTIGIALDMDNGYVWFSKNGVWQASGNPATGTNPARSNLLSIDSVWFPTAGTYYSGTSCSYNFGQRPWAYSPPAGFNAITTKNLIRPTGAALAPNQYFDSIIYTGTGSARSVSGFNFQPDFLWVKDRNSTGYHRLFDSVRGSTNSPSIYSNSNAIEAVDNLTFTSNGFSYTTDPYGGGINTNGNSHIVWGWRAGGAAVSNTNGSITSQVSANTTSGFSIVTWTGTNVSGATVGHGLGVAPNMIIVKSRGPTARSWGVYHSSIGNTGALYLDLTNTTNTASFHWNNTSPTSTVFSLGNGSVTGSAENYVGYCWAEVPGFSKFGSHTGNGSTDGAFIYCGFRPRFIMTKRTDSTGDWLLVDTARDTYNPTGKYLIANSSGAEGSATIYDIVSNGFKLRLTTDPNISGSTVIWAAFADKPFGNTNGTAR